MVVVTSAMLPIIIPALWIHITLSSLAAAALLPVLLIRHAPRYKEWSLATSSFAILVVVLVTGSGFLSRRRSSTSLHGGLGYSLSLIVVSGLVWDLYDTWSRKRRKLEFLYQIFVAGWVRIGSFLTTCLLVLLIEFDIVLGITLLFDWCSSPYTQLCFGHFGIGAWFFIHFSFCAALGVFGSYWMGSTTEGWKWTPDKLHAIFVLPAGFGLAFFGHGWNAPWDTESFQHVFLGIGSLIGGILGLVLHNLNIFPGLVSALAGYTFLTHYQDPSSPILGELHYGLGYLLVGIGLCLGLDDAFVFYQPAKQERSAFESPWQLMASFLGITAGLVIMTANSEEAALLDSLGSGSGVVFLGLFGVTMMVFAYLSALSKLVIPEKSSYTAIDTEMN